MESSSTLPGNLHSFSLYGSFAFLDVEDIKSCSSCTVLRSRSRSRSCFTTDSQSVSQSLCLGIEHPSGTCDQILLPVGMFLSEICGLVSVGHPL
jgi:hypothetical protein